MNTIKTEFSVNTGDFRQATYYALVVRYRLPFRILFIVLIFAFIYWFAARFLRLGSPNPLVFFIAGAYLIWGLLMFAGAERSVLKYIKSPDSLIGCTYSLSIDENRISIDIPERNVHVDVKISKLACVFELASMFMIYINGQQVYLLPKRDLNADQCIAIRNIFQRQCGDHFSSRFLKNH